MSTNIITENGLKHTPKQHFVLPPRSVSSPKNNSTVDCSAPIIDLVNHAPLSNLTTTNNIDTDVNIDDNPQYFATP